MYNNFTLDDWQSYASGTVYPFIIEKNEKNMVVYRRNECQIVAKPANWKEVMAIVNGDCLPIPATLATAIDSLMGGTLNNIYNPWPALADMKGKLEIALRTDPVVGLTLTRVEDTKTVELKVENAAAIWTRWNRIGYEHSTLVWFASLLLPLGRMDPDDPWRALMQWKVDNNMHLEFADAFTIKCIQHAAVGCCSAGSVKTVDVPNKTFNNLVPLFNKGEVPPGCITGWPGPYYTADEALPLLEKAYGTPEFEKLIARFDNGKMRRI